MYEKQHYRDNYVDPVKFLEQLKVERYDNTDASTMLYSTVVLESSVIVQQFSVVSIFLTIYKYSALENSLIVEIAALDFVLLFLGCVVHLFMLERGSFQVRDVAKNALIFGVLLRITSPVMQALTSSYSSDTIHALAFFFSTIHLVFHDYAYTNCESDKFSGILSLNAAIFTAIILASRLDDLETVVGLMILAVICFSLFPSTARLIKQRSSLFQILLICVLWSIESCLLYNLDKTLFAAYELLVVFLWFLGKSTFMFRCQVVFVVFNRC